MIAPYCVPDGVCTAMTVAPTNASPFSSVTLPFMLDVVVCALNEQTITAETINDKSFFIRIGFN